MAPQGSQASLTGRAGSLCCQSGPSFQMVVPGFFTGWTCHQQLETGPEAGIRLAEVPLNRASRSRPGARRMSGGYSEPWVAKGRSSSSVSSAGVRGERSFGPPPRSGPDGGESRTSAAGKGMARWASGQHPGAPARSRAQRPARGYSGQEGTLGGGEPQHGQYFNKGLEEIKAEKRQRVPLGSPGPQAGRRGRQGGAAGGGNGRQVVTPGNRAGLGVGALLQAGQLNVPTMLVTMGGKQGLEQEGGAGPGHAGSSAGSAGPQPGQQEAKDFPAVTLGPAVQHGLGGHTEAQERGRGCDQTEEATQPSSCGGPGRDSVSRAERPREVNSLASVPSSQDGGPACVEQSS